ncbi:unnamed protein product [Rhodiola kirilowii]
MVTSSVSLSEKLAATSAEAVDHDGRKLLQAEKAEVEALELELKELKQARRDATKRRAKKARPLSESGLQHDAFVSNKAMQELEDAKNQLDLDRSNFENEKFQLEAVQAQLRGKDSVSKSRMIPARDLNIIWGDNPEHWKWTSVPDTRYAVAELLEVRWHKIYGSLNASCLFPYTTYGAYLIFKLTDDSFGFEFSPAEASAAIPRGQSYYDIRNIYLVAEEDQAGPHPQRADEYEYPKRRADGWMEVELGTFFVKGDDDDDGKITMSFIEIWGDNWRKGLIVLGIELRPTLDQKSNKKETVQEGPQAFTSRCWKE